MTYLTGMYALNTPCRLKTTGDWHRCCLDWKHPEFAESSNSIWGDLWIEVNSPIPMLGTVGNKANHLRALLDLLAQGRFQEAQGAKDDFICCDDYTELFFEQVILLRNTQLWHDVSKFMYLEYRFAWRSFLSSRGVPFNAMDLASIELYSDC